MEYVAAPMKLEGLVLETEETPAGTVCSLRSEERVEVRGTVKDERMVGVWSTFADDGTVQSSVALPKDGVPVELDADVLCEEVATALLQEWLLGFERPPSWLVASGALKVKWDELDDPSPDEEVAEFPFFLHGALHPDALVRELCVRSLHRGMVDEGELFPVAPLAVPFLGAMIVQPGAPVALLAHALLDVAVSVSEAAEEAGVDLSEDDEEDELLRPTASALAGILPHVEKVLAKAKGKEAKLLKTLQAHVSKAF
jgi:hypothetical protein